MANRVGGFVKVKIPLAHLLLTKRREKRLSASLLFAGVTLSLWLVITEKCNQADIAAVKYVLAAINKVPRQSIIRPFRNYKISSKCEDALCILSERNRRSN